MHILEIADDCACLFMRYFAWNQREPVELTCKRFRHWSRSPAAICPSVIVRHDDAVGAMSRHLQPWHVRFISNTGEMSLDIATSRASVLTKYVFAPLLPSVTKLFIKYSSSMRGQTFMHWMQQLRNRENMTHLRLSFQYIMPIFNLNWIASTAPALVELELDGLDITMEDAWIFALMVNLVKLKIQFISYHGRNREANLQICSIIPDIILRNMPCLTSANISSSNLDMREMATSNAHHPNLKQLTLRSTQQGAAFHSDFVAQFPALTSLHLTSSRILFPESTTGACSGFGLTDQITSQLKNLTLHIGWHANLDNLHPEAIVKFKQLQYLDIRNSSFSIMRIVELAALPLLTYLCLADVLFRNVWLPTPCGIFPKLRCLDLRNNELGVMTQYAFHSWLFSQPRLNCALMRQALCADATYLLNRHLLTNVTSKRQSYMCDFEDERPFYDIVKEKYDYDAESCS